MSNLKKDEKITKVIKGRKFKICDYCGLELLKPDQRAAQIEEWAYIKIKETVPEPGPFGSIKTQYLTYDMCPECRKNLLTDFLKIKERKNE